MKTTAELEVEIEKLEIQKEEMFHKTYCHIHGNKTKFCVTCLNENIAKIHQVYEKIYLAKLQSLSQKIDSDVAGCKEKVEIFARPSDFISTTMLCNSVPESQKCSGCKRVLKWKRENL